MLWSRGGTGMAGGGSTLPHPAPFTKVSRGRQGKSGPAKVSLVPSLHVTMRVGSSEVGG